MLITVHVHPRASRAKATWKDGMLELWVHAPPADGGANKEVLSLVAKELGVPVSRVTLRSGARSRTKTIEVEDTRS